MRNDLYDVLAVCLNCMINRSNPLIIKIKVETISSENYKEVVL